MPAGYLILFLVVMVAYFVVVALPRKRARTAQQALLEGVEPGDEVLTAGGLIGVVQALDGDIVQLELATGVTVRLVKYPAGFTNAWHTHPCAHGMFVLEGTLVTHQGSFGPGNFVWFPEGMKMEHGAHQTESAGRSL